MTCSRAGLVACAGGMLGVELRCCRLCDYPVQSPPWASGHSGAAPAPASAQAACKAGHWLLFGRQCLHSALRLQLILQKLLLYVQEGHAKGE